MRDALLTDRLLTQLLRARGGRSEHHPTHIGPLHSLALPATGDGPPLVMLHGFSSAGVHLWPLMSRLRKARARRIIALDMPGHGLSPQPRDGCPMAGFQRGMQDALHRLSDPGPITLFGNSLGGFAAIRYAAEHPERVAGLILISPAGAPMSTARFESFRAGFAMARHGEALDFVDRLMPAGRLKRHMLAWGVRRRFAVPRHRALLMAGDATELLTPQELTRLTMPTLCLWGTRERILPQSALAFFRAHLPAHARVELPQGVGHSPYLERPGAIAQRIADFLAR